MDQKDTILTIIHNRIIRLKEIQADNIECRAWDSVGHGEFAVIELEGIMHRIAKEVGN